jgi:hypothetical protein
MKTAAMVINTSAKSGSPAAQPQIFPSFDMARVPPVGRVPGAASPLPAPSHHFASSFWIRS